GTKSAATWSCPRDSCRRGRDASCLRATVGNSCATRGDPAFEQIREAGEGPANDEIGDGEDEIDLERFCQQPVVDLSGGKCQLRHVDDVAERRLFDGR